MSNSKNKDSDNENLSFVSDFNTEKDMWNMKAKIIRKWRAPFSVDMVLIDEKGIKIQATVKNNLISVFDNQLKEDDVVLLKKFGIGSTEKDQYQVVVDKYKINFYRCTLVNTLTSWKGPEYGFQFVPYQDILTGKTRDKSIVDVAGTVSWCGNLDVFGRPPKESKRISLDLQNLECMIRRCVHSQNVRLQDRPDLIIRLLENKLNAFIPHYKTLKLFSSKGSVLRCTLWNAYAQQFGDFLSKNASNDHVMAMFQHAKVKEWRGEITVQSDKFGTRIFLNEDINEVNQLRKSLILKQVQSTGSTSQTILSTQTVYPLRQEFVLSTVKKHVDEITDIKEEMCCVVVATIKSVEESFGWFYPACFKCNKKVLSKSEYLECVEDIGEDILKLPATATLCSKCKCECTLVTTKFKVQVRVQDGTGSLSFVMFDRDVMRIIGASASDIRERHVQCNDTKRFPHELAHLVDKRLAFKIEITEFNFENEYHVYTALKICDDPIIIAELVTADENVDEVSQQSIGLKDVAVEDSPEGVGKGSLKDVVSVTGDSSVVEAEKDEATSPNGKRPAVVVVQEEPICDVSSSTKRSRKKSAKFSN